MLLNLAHAERVVLIAPNARGVDGTALAAELQDAIDRGFAAPGRYQRASDGMIMADELVAMFGCARLDPDCARQAARAAEADLVLLPNIERRGPAVTVRLELLDPNRISPHHTAVWVIEPADRVDQDDALARALRAAVQRFLRRDPPSAILVSRPTHGAIEIDGQRINAGPPVTVRPGLHEIRRPGWPTRRITIQAGEIYLISAPSKARIDQTQPATRYTAGWIVAGAGAAAFITAGVLGGQLNATQRAYNATTEGTDLDTLAREGQQQALAANALFITSALAFGTAAWLFWGP